MSFGNVGVWMWTHKKKRSYLTKFIDMLKKKWEKEKKSPKRLKHSGIHHLYFETVLPATAFRYVQ